MTDLQLIVIAAGAFVGNVVVYGVLGRRWSECCGVAFIAGLLTLGVGVLLRSFSVL